VDELVDLGAQGLVQRGQLVLLPLAGLFPVVG
jgi:hypothetical protein